MTMPVGAIPALVLLLAALASPTWASDTATEREYQLKAAFLYNFLAFVDGPRLEPPDSDDEQNGEKEVEPIVIGVIGQDPFGTAFEPLKDKEVRGRPVAIRRFKGLQWKVEADGSKTEDFPNFEQIRKCHILFVAASEREHIALILGRLKGDSLLTVSDVPGFLEAGGTINFVIEEKKVRFEINAAAAARAKLEIRSRLLRLAKRIVKTDLVEEEENDGNKTPTSDQ